MPGPTGVNIAAPVPAQAPPPTTMGVITENTFAGVIADWQVKEFIDLDDDEDVTSKGIFDVRESYTSDWLDADPGPGQHRIDSHLLSTSSINFGKMQRDGTRYTCGFTQVFRKRAKGAEDSDRMQASGFTITHTVTWQNGQWEYFSEKTGAAVLTTTAGAGTVRYPLAGWARVPI
jgi:hypothetical protein